MPALDASRLHPSRWPIVVWALATAGIAVLRVDYTIGSLSLAPAVALLSGTWLGSLRGAIVQVLATAVLIFTAAFTSMSVSPGEWGFRFGLVVSAALAGMIARPDDKGAHPPRSIQLTVLSVAGATAAMVLMFVPRVTAVQVGVQYGLTLLLASVIAIYYAYKMVPESGRVVGYFFCLLPYYTAGCAGTVLLTTLSPDAAAAAGVPDRWSEILFHAYFSHLPGELISLVVIAYMVCVVDRGGAADGPLAISASR